MRRCELHEIEERMPVEPYEQFKNAIILQAVKDYRKARKTLRKNKRNQKAKWLKEDCEQFFTGAWFEELTDINGTVILNKLNEEKA